MSKMRETVAAGSDFWNDSCDLDQLQEAVNAGAVGATSNPVIISKVLVQKKHVWEPELAKLLKDFPEASETELVWKLVVLMGKKAAKILEPVHEKTKGLKGKLSLQVSPEFYPSAQKMIEHGQELAETAPNIAIKVPAIPSGLVAMEELTARGISINATVSFSVAQAIACAEAVERGFQKAKDSGVSCATVTPYITIMVGRVEDQVTKDIVKAGLVVDPSVIPWSGPAVFKRAHEIFKQRAYRSTLLSAAYRHQLQWSELIGKGSILSMPYDWWKKFDTCEVKVRPSLDEPITDERLHALLKIRSFRQMYEEQGLQTSQFKGFEASQYSLHQFLGALDDLRRFVRTFQVAV